MKVTKADGAVVPFDANKIRRSLFRANAKAELVEKILEVVNREIYDGIPTSELYRMVFVELKRLQKGIAGKYNLKQAIMELGPTGFPFEKYVAALLHADGFSIETGVVISGYCVNHEVDVIAEKQNLHWFIECKFHSFQGTPCDVKHALYVYARFLDIEKKLKTTSAHADKTHRMWLVTNTRLTSDAIAYGTCAGLELLSWDFPYGNGLRERIDRAGLHPITCMTSLSQKETRQLLQRGIVMCRELIDKPDILIDIGITKARIEEVFNEADSICNA